MQFKIETTYLKGNVLGTKFILLSCFDVRDNRADHSSELKVVEIWVIIKSNGNKNNLYYYYHNRSIIVNFTKIFRSKYFNYVTLLQ